MLEPYPKPYSGSGFKVSWIDFQRGQCSAASQETTRLGALTAGSHSFGGLVQLALRPQASLCGRLYLEAHITTSRQKSNWTQLASPVLNRIISAIISSFYAPWTKIGSGLLQASSG